MEYRGVKVERKVKTGTPQGGVLSPILWNLAFDELLDRIDPRGPVKAIGFADDLVLLAGGLDPNTLMDLLQPVINMVAKWGSDRKLKFSHSKSNAVLFTNKHDSAKVKRRKLKMGGGVVEWKPSVKYLGVILDSKLNFTEHLTDKLGKAKRALMAYKGVANKIWGPTPRCIHWIYSCVIKPIITYGCLVWWQAADKRGIMDKFSKLNRLAALSWGSLYRSTPTAGLEAICYLQPLDLLAKELALMALNRLPSLPRWDGLGTGGRRSHIRALLDESERMDLPRYIWDEIPVTKCWVRLYALNKASFKEGVAVSDEVVCYTDGSKLDSKAGAGVVIQKGEETWTLKFPLGKMATVFQAEIFAIQQAAILMREMECQSVTIMSDSQAALLAVDNCLVKSSVVWDTIQRLNELGVNKRVTLRWVKAHVGISGNEQADSLAKEGTVDVFIGPEPIIPVATRLRTMNIKKAVDKLWQERWEVRKVKFGDCRQSLILWPNINKKFSFALLRAGNRALFSHLIQYISGHCDLGYHSRMMGSIGTDACRFCAESREEANHLVLRCPDPRLTALRIDITKEAFNFTIEDVSKINIGMLIRLIKEITIIVNNGCTNVIL